MAESSEPLDSRSAIYLMCAFPKGMFQPTVSEDDTFEHRKQLALEGSDYEQPENSKTDLLFAIIAFVIIGIVCLGFVALFLYLIYIYVRNRIRLWKIAKSVTWYRDIPVNGDLKEADSLLKGAGFKQEGLLSACILQLVNVGAFSIELKEGKQLFCINDLPEGLPQLQRHIHKLFAQAAGSDRMLDPGELKSFIGSRKNRKVVGPVVKAYSGRVKHTLDYIYTHDEQLEQVRQVLGLKKFLQEFTLMDERHVQEVALWKDYMVWATLFGISRQVISDMRKINPEYFELDTIASQMATAVTLPSISTTFTDSVRQYQKRLERERISASSSRSSGGGGYSSFGGGGGGFSGGGGGGGVR